PSIPLSYGQSSPTFVNTLGGWIVNPTMPQMFHPMFNPHQPYAVLPLSPLMWNNFYPQTAMQPPFIPVSLEIC
ncbi:unnamed protein product, partial [Adineta ricciae]